ncbi:MAG: hypothetical protein IKV56_00810, partial [Kiritimatiellae bacterium]|nr:hypothetical protein [Kiritimatiellia bacterium]
MLYSSTRGGDHGLHFRDTVLTGLARDGGLAYQLVIGLAL